MKREADDAKAAMDGLARDKVHTLIALIISLVQQLGTKICESSVHNHSLL